MRLMTLFCVLASPAWADICPASPDHSARVHELFEGLAVAESQAQADGLNAELWALWTDAPDDKAQLLLDQGMQLRAMFDLLNARDVLDQLVEYCPDFAEGYNQRAFVSYLRQDYAAALIDIDRTLALNPNHTGALSGKALTLIGMGQMDGAQEALRAAVALNPWLQERALLTEPLGQDI
ncbi:hypothetical protein [Yoonia sp. BS5-3]|uniref:Tetratricopeptide repeat protein n=1 Tax=Yoonia phaeophyticola TaxID=3137369 RepID=A0ABZ2V1T5_9RHOB